MTDHYDVLGVSSSASQEEIRSALEACLADRRARRRSASDLHAAAAVIGDPTLRRAYDLARIGEAAGNRLVHARAVTVEFAKDAMPEVDLNEVRRHAWQTLLRATVLATGVVAKVSEVTGPVARHVQQEAAMRITQ